MPQPQTCIHSPGTLSLHPSGLQQIYWAICLYAPGPQRRAAMKKVKRNNTRKGANDKFQTYAIFYFCFIGKWFCFLYYFSLVSINLKGLSNIIFNFGFLHQTTSLWPFSYVCARPCSCPFLYPCSRPCSCPCPLYTCLCPNPCQCSCSCPFPVHVHVHVLAVSLELNMDMVRRRTCSYTVQTSERFAFQPIRQRSGIHYIYRLQNLGIIRKYSTYKSERDQIKTSEQFP